MDPFISLAELSHLVRWSKLSAREAALVYLDRIDKFNPALNAYLAVFREGALAEADAVDKDRVEGFWRGPAHGAPIAIKDNVDTAGHATTAGGVLLPQTPAAEDADAIEKLRASGLVFLGKTNLHEYAWGGLNENVHYGRAFNPWRENYSPGGSSGGSGAAVAAGLCAAAVGTDTLGSVRIPASYCGIVGLKCTYGLVSLRGVFPLAWSLDSVGAMARSVEDAAILLAQMTGFDGRDPSSSHDFAHLDPTSLGRDGESPEALAKGTKIAVVRGWSLPQSDSADEREVTQAVGKAIDQLVRLGCERFDVDLPEMMQTRNCAVTIALAEGAALHRERVENSPNSIGPDVMERLRAGLALKATDLALAYRERTLLRHRLEAAMDAFDCVVTPTTPMPANAFEKKAAARTGHYTSTANLLGTPAISVPCGFTSEGLPVGMMLMGKRFDEMKLLRIARAYEASTDWKDRRPAGF